LQQDVNRIKVLQEGEMVHLDKARDDSSHDDKSAKSPKKRRQELKVSRYDYNKERIKVVIQNFRDVLQKA